MQTGWIKDPVAVDASTVALGGNRVLFGNQPNLKGFAQREIASGNKAALNFLAEKEVLGRFYPPFHQKRGTCVGQGGTRALQTGLYSQILWKGLISRPVFIAVAPGYAGSRIQIGKGQIRNGDGSIGSWFAEFVDKYGAAERKAYDQYDLSQYNGDESYAVNWGRSGTRGVPDVVLQGMKHVKINVYRCMTGMDIFDALYARLGVAFCGGYTVGDKDSNGYSRLNKPANHCTELSGAIVDIHGDYRIGNQQSWGPNSPRGTNVIKYKGGQTEMRESMGFCPVEDYDRELKRQGEAWAFEFVEAFR